jgi:prepilin-type N-terminal cleavage/methylation domain-containing protein
MDNRGFSLVELSIVLVILGLLTGGILGGQALIRAAELRSVQNDIQRYSAAALTFRDKYFGLPGDITNATAFWGTDSAGCPNGAGATGTCNGDGTGYIGSGGTSNFSNTCENQEFWRQLGLAGLIEGRYTTRTGGQCFQSVTPGLDAPKLRIGQAAITISQLGPITTNATFPGTVAFIGDYTNVFSLGGSSVNGAAGTAFLAPEELWNIDTKMDDGRPSTGRVLSLYPGTYNPAAGANGCVTTNDATTAAYTLSNKAVSCGMLVKPSF